MLHSVDLRFWGIPLLVVVCILVVTLVATFLRHYPIGRRIYAVGSNPLASVFYGVRIQRVVLLAYGLGGLVRDFACLLYAARVGTGKGILPSRLGEGSAVDEVIRLGGGLGRFVALDMCTDA